MGPRAKGLGERFQARVPPWTGPSGPSVSHDDHSPPLPTGAQPQGARGVRCSQPPGPLLHWLPAAPGRPPQELPARSWRPAEFPGLPTPPARACTQVTPADTLPHGPRPSAPPRPVVPTVSQEPHFSPHSVPSPSLQRRLPWAGTASVMALPRPRPGRGSRCGRNKRQDE